MAHSEEMLEQISLALDGELSPEEQARLWQHLKECGECRETYEALKRIQNVLGELEEVEPPQDFANKVMERVREERAVTKVLPFWRRPQGKALAGLAACALLCVGLYYGTQNRNGEPIMVTYRNPAQAEQGEAAFPDPYTASDPGREADTRMTREGGVPTDGETLDPSQQDGPTVDSRQPMQSNRDSDWAAQRQETEGSLMPAAQVQRELEPSMLVVDSLPEGAAELLPPVDQWKPDDSGGVSCSVTEEIFEQLCQLAEQSEGSYSVVRDVSADTFTIYLKETP